MSHFDEKEGLACIALDGTEQRLPSGEAFIALRRAMAEATQARDAAQRSHDEALATVCEAILSGEPREALAEAMGVAGGLHVAARERVTAIERERVSLVRWLTKNGFTNLIESTGQRIADRLAPYNLERFA